MVFSSFLHLNLILKFGMTITVIHNCECITQLVINAITKIVFEVESAKKMTILSISLLNVGTLVLWALIIKQSNEKLHKETRIQNELPTLHCYLMRAHVD